jgi:D-lyxose ketol-isomerase
MRRSEIDTALVEAAASVRAFGIGLPKGNDDPADNASGPPARGFAAVDEDAALLHLLVSDDRALPG